MKRVFVDTVYWIALVDPEDQWHDAAVQARRTVGEAAIVTSDDVLSEFLDGLASGGPHLRQRAASMVRAILASAKVEVLRQSRRSFLAGLDFFERRADKGYSLTDCISMAAMRRLGIREALTSDHHFAQEGFTVLIRPTDR